MSLPAVTTPTPRATRSSPTSWLSLRRRAGTSLPAAASGAPSWSGDLNVAPLEDDVWSHRQLLDVVSHTPIETAALTAWLASGFTDAVRHFVPEPEKLFTWWSYRNRDWHLSDRGRRLDHVWVSNDMAGALARHAVFKEARDWKLASDHVPVVVELRP